MNKHIQQKFPSLENGSNKTELINKQITIKKFVKISEEHYLKIEGDFKGPFVINCSYCDKISMSPYEFQIHLLEIHNIQVPQKNLNGAFPLFLQCEKIDVKKFLKFSENQYLKISGEVKGPFNIQCFKCDNLSKNTFEFDRHLLEIHNILSPPYECFVPLPLHSSYFQWLQGFGQPQIYHKCNYKSEKDHFSSFLAHYNENHIQSKYLVLPPLSASQFENLYEYMTGRKICKNPVGCFVEMKEFKSQIKLKKDDDRSAICANRYNQIKRSKSDRAGVNIFHNSGKFRKFMKQKTSQMSVSPCF